MSNSDRVSGLNHSMRGAYARPRCVQNAFTGLQFKWMRQWPDLTATFKIQIQTKPRLGIRLHTFKTTWSRTSTPSQTL